MGIFLSLFLILNFLSGAEINSQITDDFIKKNWKEAINKIKTAEVKYSIERMDAITKKVIGIDKCLWRYKDGKERLDVEILNEKGEIERKMFFIGKEWKTIRYVEVYENLKNEPEKGVSITQGYGFAFSYLTPSEILFRIPSLPLPIEESIKKFKLKEITSDYFKMEYSGNFKTEFHNGQIKLYWEIFLSKSHFLPLKIHVDTPNTEFIYIIEYTKKGEIWFPEKVKMEGISKNEKRKLGGVIIYEDIKVNEEISDEIFNPVFPKGLEVYDAISGISYENE